MDPSPSHTLTTAFVGQTISPPRVQQRTSSSVGSEHVDDGGRPPAPTYSSSNNPLLDSSEPLSSPHRDLEYAAPQTPKAQNGEGYLARTIHGIGHALGASGLGNAFGTSGVPVVQEFMREKPQQDASATKHNLEERLRATIVDAEHERDACIYKATWTTWTLNIAVGLQVLFGALTTALSSALSAKQVAVALPLLGGMSTTVAAYIAQARGSGEPDASKCRVRKLNQFLRECHAFIYDHGTDFAEKDDDLDHQLHDLRKKFEDLLGNTDGQKKRPQKRPERRSPPADSDGDTKT